jgi:hypothetical protein
MKICFKWLRQLLADAGIPLAIAVGWLIGLLGVMSSAIHPTALDKSIRQVLSASRASNSDSSLGPTAAAAHRQVRSNN